MKPDDALRMMRLAHMRPGDALFGMLCFGLAAWHGERLTLALALCLGWLVNFAWRAWLRRKVGQLRAVQ